MICSDIIAKLQQLSPDSFACQWDNVGLLVGHKEAEIHRILLVLDATVDAVEYGVKTKADMIISHHPMIFSPVKRVTDEEPCGNKILMLAENHIAYYAMHTNFDIMGSMADIAAEKIGLKDSTPLEVTYRSESAAEGIGRVGELSCKCNVRELAQLVKKEFYLSDVSVYGNLDEMVNRVAISPGSGKSMIEYALQAKAQVLVTGDIGHHEGLDAVEQGLTIIDASHYGLEHVFTDYMKNYLKDTGLIVDVYDSGRPFQIV